MSEYQDWQYRQEAKRKARLVIGLIGVVAIVGPEMFTRFVDFAGGNLQSVLRLISGH